LLTDNDWNWRFREELADQLLAAVNLFTPEDTRKHLTPIAVSLLLDKVAAVRQVALCLVSTVYFLQRLMMLQYIKEPEILYCLMSFWILTVVSMKVTVFWVVAAVWSGRSLPTFTDVGKLLPDVVQHSRRQIASPYCLSVSLLRY
jgi:hypothetical protein